MEKERKRSGSGTRFVKVRRVPIKAGKYEFAVADRTARASVFQRKKALERLHSEKSVEALWNAVVAFQEYRFRTYSGLVFSYRLKKGREGAYTKELFIDRCEKSKSLAWSSVLLAFGKTEGCPLVKRPKAP